MKRAIRQSIRNKAKRSTGGCPTAAGPVFFLTLSAPSPQPVSDVPVDECTVGTITQVIIHDEAFPFDYDDLDQFDRCLNASVVRENLAAIVAKVDQEEFQRVVLDKLREVSLNSASRVRLDQHCPAEKCKT